MRATYGRLQFECLPEHCLGFIPSARAQEILSEVQVIRSVQRVQSNGLPPQDSGFIPPALDLAERGQNVENDGVLLARVCDLSFSRRKIPISKHVNGGKVSMRLGEVGLEGEGSAEGGPRFFKWRAGVRVTKRECSQGGRFPDIGFGITRIERDCMVEQRNCAIERIRVSFFRLNR